MNSIRTWTQTGAELRSTPQAQARIERAIERLDWSVRPGDEVGMMPGLAISKLIREFRIPKVSACAISSDLAPYGLYGIEGNYKNGRARIYVVDRGADLLPVASDHWPA